jgi:uncharacterized protein (DUF2141 family)
MSLRFYFLIAFSILFYGCANMLAPTGGPQDTVAPKVLKSLPTNNQINYKQSEIRIQFDEYFSLDNFSKELLVSPPLKHPIDHKISKKTLIVKWTDTLLENKTYTFLFGNSIKDINEGNVLENFVLTFSTGPDIDSVTSTGNIITIDKKEPLKNTFVYLTEKPFFDSLFFPVQAEYVTKTNSEGVFKFQGLKPGSYNIFYLEDKNGNKMPDNGEYVGFGKNKVEISYPEVTQEEEMEGEQEDVKKEREENSNKTEYEAPPDSLIAQKENNKSETYEAFPFFSENKKFFKSVNSIGAAHVVLLPQENIYPRNLVLKYVDDTLFSYVRQDSLFAFSSYLDSFTISVFTADGDTLLLSDTIRKLAKSAAPIFFQKQRKLGQEDKKEITFLSNYPIIDLDTSKIIVKHSDSILVEKQVSWNAQGFNIFPEIEAPQTISITFLDSFSRYDDSSYFVKPAQHFVSFPDPKSVSNFELKLKRKSVDFVDVPLMILIEKEGKKDLFYLSQKDTILQINAIESGSYLVTVFADPNRNKLWDTGNIFKFKQAEAIFKLPNPIEVKEGWDGDAELEL